MTPREFKQYCQRLGYRVSGIQPVKTGIVALVEPTPSPKHFTRAYADGSVFMRSNLTKFNN